MRRLQVATMRIIWVKGGVSIATDGEIDSGRYNSLFCRTPKYSLELSDEEEYNGDEQIEKTYSRKEEEAKQKEEQERRAKKILEREAESYERRSRARVHLSRPAQPQETVELSFLAYGVE